MPRIHRTAIVEDGAELASDVIVGAYAYVGGEVKLGTGCVLGNLSIIQGRTTIGENCQFHAGSVIGGIPQDLKYHGEPSELVVGDNNIFREHSTVHIGTEGGGMFTRVGSNNLLMAGIHIAHDCQIGSGVIMANYSLLAGHVELEDGARISGLAAVHQFVRVGRNSFISGLAKVVQDIPPFMIADGHPARIRSLNIEGMKRMNIARETINAMKELFRLLYRSDLNRSQAIREIRQSDSIDLPEIQEVLRFLDVSDQGRKGRTGEATRERGPAPAAGPDAPTARAEAGSGRPPPAQDSEKPRSGDEPDAGAIAAGNGGDGDDE